MGQRVREGHGARLWEEHVLRLREGHDLGRATNRLRRVALQRLRFADRSSWFFPQPDLMLSAFNKSRPTISLANQYQ
jgi:hypothetical protein